MRSSAEVRQQLRDWILKRASKKKRVELTDDTLLVEQGHISSLQLLELSIFIGSLRGEPIDFDAPGFSPDSFRCIDSIVSSFFPEAP